MLTIILFLKIEAYEIEVSKFCIFNISSLPLKTDILSTENSTTGENEVFKTGFSTVKSAPRDDFATFCTKPITLVFDTKAGNITRYVRKINKTATTVDIALIAQNFLLKNIFFIIQVRIRIIPCLNLCYH